MSEEVTQEPATTPENMSVEQLSEHNQQGTFADTQDRTGAFEATSGGSPFTSSDKSETIITRATDIEPDLEPTPTTPEPTVADFGKPLLPYEVDNLKYALTETPKGINVIIALEENQGILSDEIIAQAKSAGVSQRQIDGYQSHIINTANKVFIEAGLSFSQGRNLVQRAQREFSPAEMEIFNRETDADAVKSMRTLKTYFDNQG